MAHNERVTTPNRTRKAARAGFAAFAAATALASPNSAESAPVKGLYATVQEGSYASAASKSDGVSREGGAKGGIVKLRPGAVPSTIRFDVSYPAVSNELVVTDPDDPTSDVALKSLTTTIFKVRGKRGIPIARVDVYGNGIDNPAGKKDVGVHKRMRVNTDVDICKEPKIAIIAETSLDTGLVPDALPESPLGEIHSTLISESPVNISEAEIVTPKC